MFERLCICYRCQFGPCLMDLLPISILLVVRSFVYQLRSVLLSALRLFGIPSCSSHCALNVSRGIGATSNGQTPTPSSQSAL